MNMALVADMALKLIHLLFRAFSGHSGGEPVLFFFKQGLYCVF